jgi:hypothetical protein
MLGKNGFITPEVTAGVDTVSIWISGKFVFVQQSQVIAE